MTASEPAVSANTFVPLGETTSALTEPTATVPVTDWVAASMMTTPVACPTNTLPLALLATTSVGSAGVVPRKMLAMVE